jgi:hypothetical protein
LNDVAKEIQDHVHSRRYPLSSLSAAWNIKRNQHHETPDKEENDELDNFPKDIENCLHAFILLSIFVISRSGPCSTLIS